MLHILKIQRPSSKLSYTAFTDALGFFHNHPAFGQEKRVLEAMKKHCNPSCSPKTYNETLETPRCRGIVEPTSAPTNAAPTNTTDVVNTPSAPTNAAPTKTTDDAWKRRDDRAREIQSQKNLTEAKAQIEALLGRTVSVDPPTTGDVAKDTTLHQLVCLDGKDVEIGSIVGKKVLFTYVNPDGRPPVPRTTVKGEVVRVGFSNKGNLCVDIKNSAGTHTYSIGCMVPDSTMQLVSKLCVKFTGMTFRGGNPIEYQLESTQPCHFLHKVARMALAQQKYRLTDSNGAEVPNGAEEISTLPSRDGVIEVSLVNTTTTVQETTGQATTIDVQPTTTVQETTGQVATTDVIDMEVDEATGEEAPGAEVSLPARVLVNFGSETFALETSTDTTGERLKELVKEQAMKDAVTLPTTFIIDYRHKEKASRMRCQAMDTVQQFMDNQKTRPVNADLSIRIAKAQANRSAEEQAERRKREKENEGKTYTSSAHPSLNNVEVTQEKILDNQEIMMGQNNDIAEKLDKQEHHRKLKDINDQDNHDEIMEATKAVPDETAGKTADKIVYGTMPTADQCNTPEECDRALALHATKETMVKNERPEVARLKAKKRALEGRPEPTKRAKTIAPESSFTPTTQDAINNFFNSGGDINPFRS